MTKTDPIDVTPKLDIFMDELIKCCKDPKLQEAFALAMHRTNARFALEQDEYTRKGS